MFRQSKFGRNRGGKKSDIIRDEIACDPHWTDFREIWYWEFYEICLDNPSLVEIGAEKKIGHYT